MGTEVALWEQLILRAGGISGSESRTVSLGVGIRKSFFHLDYSYTPLQNDLGSGQRFSLYLTL
ncbi:MAG: hypothetical protein D6681_04640 [Calditrichaeota bacterium]|nr:MAG: hypothetical protein D6681_04640 [Calditrichota bacterium]